MNSNNSKLKLKLESKQNSLHLPLYHKGSPQMRIDNQPVYTEPTTNNMSSIDRPVKGNDQQVKSANNKMASSIVLPPRPTSAFDGRKKSLKQGGNMVKIKNLFLNEDDVDNFITYPPKLQESVEDMQKLKVQ